MDLNGVKFGMRATGVKREYPMPVEVPRDEAAATPTPKTEEKQK